MPVIRQEMVEFVRNVANFTKDFIVQNVTEIIANQEEDKENRVGLSIDPNWKTNLIIIASVICGVVCCVGCLVRCNSADERTGRTPWEGLQEAMERDIAQNATRNLNATESTSIMNQSPSQNFGYIAHSEAVRFGMR